jgi:hypothetical protein
MTVIAFRRRRDTAAGGPDNDGAPVTGTFRSPRGVTGVMTGSLRLQRLVLVPRGTFVTGVFTGELREPDGTLVGRESRRATVEADLIRDDGGLHPLVRPFQLDLMGISVRVHAFAIEPAHAFPVAQGRGSRARTARVRGAHGDQGDLGGDGGHGDHGGRR